MLGIFTGLIFIEQRQDLTDHGARRIIFQFLRDRDEPDLLLRKTSDVELQIKVIPEKTAERMHNDNIETPWFF
ncbi:hypothetical protein ATR1_023c0018 [Acetobacter tropicalis]|nr:hypothetical protein ATR1_023c0018 [Acetobacter tropicalis]